MHKHDFVLDIFWTEDLSDKARLLALGMRQIADHDGMLFDTTPKLLRATFFPHDLNVKIKGLVRELRNAGLLSTSPDGDIHVVRNWAMQRAAKNTKAAPFTLVPTFFSDLPRKYWTSQKPLRKLRKRATRRTK